MVVSSLFVTSEKLGVWRLLVFVVYLRSICPMLRPLSPDHDLVVSHSDSQVISMIMHCNWG
jgi:hypothetical protein